MHGRLELIAKVCRRMQFNFKRRSRRRWTPFDVVATIVSVSLLAASVVRELRKPPGERTWRGVVFGWIPYDLRLPTLSRVRQTLWQPERRDLLVPTAFGVGWTVNVAALVRPFRPGARSSTA
jgi:hypothetical protein